MRSEGHGFLVNFAKVTVSSKFTDRVTDWPSLPSYSGVQKPLHARTRRPASLLTTLKNHLKNAKLCICHFHFQPQYIQTKPAMSSNTTTQSAASERYVSVLWEIGRKARNSGRDELWVLNMINVMSHRVSLHANDRMSDPEKRWLSEYMAWDKLCKYPASSSSYMPTPTYLVLNSSRTKQILPWKGSKQSKPDDLHSKLETSSVCRMQKAGIECLWPGMPLHWCWGVPTTRGIQIPFWVLGILGPTMPCLLEGWEREEREGRGGGESEEEDQAEGGERGVGEGWVVLFVMAGLGVEVRGRLGVLLGID